MKERQHWRLVPVVALAFFWSLSGTVPAAHYVGNPQNYTKLLAKLKAGDTLQLEPGRYERGLRAHNLHGKPGFPVVIRGAAGKMPSVILGHAGRNTVSIKDASHVVIRDLEIDGRGAFVDGVKAEGHARYAHHITLENLHIHNFAPKQQSVGISTKCPAWDWVVRGNRVRGVGTGMYFGNSDGSAPFVGGLIEDNEVSDTIGYNLQVKHQKVRPSLAGMPVEPRQTIIRNNRFAKGERSSTAEQARPNVLVGHFPLSGPGRKDTYLIYGNLFFQNPNEALFQGEGNIALYDNLFFNSHRNDFPAIAIQPHNDIPRQVTVLHNTVVHRGGGIRVLRREENWVDTQEIVGNAVFADPPLEGGRRQNNFTRHYSEVTSYLLNPSDDPRELDLSPRPALLAGSPVELGRFRHLPDFDRDYRGLQRYGRFYGACLPGQDDGCGAFTSKKW